jgi:MoaA/NifB/PqqE/SkfB family radical SAM enzyme
MNKYTESLKYFYQKASRLKRPFIKYPVSESGFNAIDKSKMDEFNTVRYHGPKKLACYNPFVNLYFNSRGQGVICCRNQDTVLGTYPEKSIKEIWHGEVAEKLRETLRHNDFSMGCEYCAHQFNTSRFFGLPSMHADYYSINTVKGEVAYPKIIELELSNTCNLQCVMCSGIVSSSIRKCRENLPPLENHYDEEFVKQLSEFLPHAKEIKFYGGEPFLIDVYYKIWDQLLAINSRAKLHVVTNGTVLTDKVRNYLKKLNFTITVSFDALDKESFESIRVGADFDKVKKNIEEYNILLGGKGLSLSLTPMKMNCKEVPKVIDFCNSMNATINLSFVENPSEMAIWTMKSTDLEEIENYYKSYVFNSYSGVNSNYNIAAYRQFVNQLGVYKINNKQCEDIFQSSLKSELECMNLLDEILEQTCAANVILASDKLEILSHIINKKSQLPIELQLVFLNNLYSFLSVDGINSIKKIMTPSLDITVLDQKLQDFVVMPKIYDKSYNSIS